MIYGKVTDEGRVSKRLQKESETFATRADWRNNDEHPEFEYYKEVHYFFDKDSNEVIAELAVLTTGNVRTGFYTGAKVVDGKHTMLGAFYFANGDAFAG